MLRFIKPHFVLNTTNTIIRNFASKKEFCKQMNWTRPVKIPCFYPEKSGDLKPFPTIDPNEFVLEYRNSKELETADDLVKDLFRLRLNKQRKTLEFAERSMMDTVKRHVLDYGSMESTLASMTAKIRNLQPYVLEYPRNKKVKVYLKELIDKRKRYLRYLRRWDYKRFEWILEKLQLVYKPYPTKFHLIERKASIRKLAHIHCDNVQKERLEAYRRMLESQQLDFLQKKIENLKFIRNEQMECKLPITITEEQINDTIKKYTEIKEIRKPTEVTKGRKQRGIIMNN